MNHMLKQEIKLYPLLPVLKDF